MNSRHPPASTHRKTASRVAASTARVNWRLLISGALLVVAVVFGGGGTPSPSTEFVVEIAALAALTAWAWLAPRDRDYSALPIDWSLLILTAVVMATPALQLIPLPPAIWHQLPGREIEVRALTLVGRDTAWMPLSVSPPGTIASLFSLIPPVAMLFMVSRLRSRDRTRLIGLLAILGLAAAVVGAVQLASGGAHWLRFYEFATGFQANRNADADVLLIALIALGAWFFVSDLVRQSFQGKVLAMAVALFLMLSVILTGSRTGMSLIVLAIVVLVAMSVLNRMWKNWRIAVLGVAGVLVLISAGFFLSHNARIERTLGRFNDEELIRPEIWKDTIYAIGQHWPVGSGVGTFQPVFSAAERLEFVRPDFSNRAHNDYLEFALEAGVMAPILLIAAAIFALLRLKQMLAGNVSRRVQTTGLFVLGSLVVLLLHSLVDYPERSLSLAVVTGMLAGLLGRVGPGLRRSGSSEGAIG